MIGEPLQAEETTKYNDVAKRFFQENNIKATKSTKLPIPSLETINNYLKRFNYTISFTTADKQYKISKTICNFFNGERILSDNTWREKMQPARLMGRVWGGVFLLLTTSSCSIAQSIKVNQVGYYPSETKVAVIEPTVTAKSFTLKDAKGKKVWAGKAVRTSVSPFTQKVRQIVDFSTVKTPGTYTFVAGKEAINGNVIKATPGKHVVEVIM